MSHPKPFIYFYHMPSDLKNAVGDRDHQLVIHLLRELPSIFLINNIEASMISAIYMDNITTIDTIVKEFNIDIKLHEDLMKAAVWNNKADIVKYLLDSGMDINIDNEYPIRACCYFGQCSSELLTLLISYGANVQTEYLQWTIHGNKLDHIKILLDANADIHAMSDDSLLECAENWETDTLKLLLEYRVNIRANNEYALKCAISVPNNHLMVQLLLDSNADIHANNETALANAILNSDLEMVKLLLNNGAICANLPTCKASEKSNRVFQMIELLEKEDLSMRKIITYMYTQPY
jgi:ankyrin repeat protein